VIALLVDFLGREGDAGANVFTGNAVFSGDRFEVITPGKRVQDDGHRRPSPADDWFAVTN